MGGETDRSGQGVKGGERERREGERTELSAALLPLHGGIAAITATDSADERLWRWCGVGKMCQGGEGATDVPVVTETPRHGTVRGRGRAADLPDGVKVVTVP